MRPLHRSPSGTTRFRSKGSRKTVGYLGFRFHDGHESPACRAGQPIPAHSRKSFPERPPARGRSRRAVWARRPDRRSSGLLVVLFEFASGGTFLSFENMRGILGLMPEMGLVAIGVSILKIAGRVRPFRRRGVRARSDGNGGLDGRRLPVRSGGATGPLGRRGFGFLNGFITLASASPPS